VIRLGSVVAAVLAVAACSALPGVLPGGPPASLEGTTWQVVGINGRAPIAGSEPDIAFKGGMVQGSMGCNSFTGVFQVQGTTVAMTQLSTSDAACLEPLATQERLFMQALAGAQGIRMDGERLVIGGPGGELVLQQVFLVPAGEKGERPFGILT
jgi:heat shock protein HslJ